MEHYAENAPPIEDDELLYRRILDGTGKYDPDNQEFPVSGKAFRPNRLDTTGLSFSRSKFTTPEEEAGRGAEGKNYYIGTACW